MLDIKRAVGFLLTYQSIVMCSKPVFEPKSELSKGSLVKVGERTEYVPLGRHFSINCDALESVLKNGYEPTSFKWFFIVSKESAEVPTDENSRFTSDENYQLIGFTVQKEHQGSYDCHVVANDTNEWVSRVNILVQDCDPENELKAYINYMNPCLYGGCSIANYSNAPMVQYLKCSCILQYTGEFCTELVTGAYLREAFRYSPFIGHMVSVGMVFVYFFCCRRGSRANLPRISLYEVVPQPPDVPLDLKELYRQAYLTVHEEHIESPLNPKTVSLIMQQLKEDTGSKK